MMALFLAVFLADVLLISNAYMTPIGSRRFKVQSIFEKIAEPASIDPNFEAHLPDLLKVGTAEDRPTPDMAVELRKRFKVIEGKNN